MTALIVGGIAIGAMLLFSFVCDKIRKWIDSL